MYKLLTKLFTKGTRQVMTVQIAVQSHFVPPSPFPSTFITRHRMLLLQTHGCHDN